MCTAPIAGAGSLAARMDALVAHSEEAAIDGDLSGEEVKSLRAEAESILGDRPTTMEGYGDRTIEDAASSAASLKSALAVARADGEVTANEIDTVKSLVDVLNKTLTALPTRHDAPAPPAMPATPAPTDAQAAADSQKAAADSQKAAADSQLAAADAQKATADAQKAAADAQLAAADAQKASAEAALAAANGHGRKAGHGHGHRPGDGHKVGSPGHHGPGDGHKVGSPGHHAPGDGHKIGSPGHPHTPGDGHKVGSPGHKHDAAILKATSDVQKAVDAQKAAADVQKTAADAQMAAADAQKAAVAAQKTAADAQTAAVDAQKAAADAQKVGKVEPTVIDAGKDAARAKGIAQGIATLVSDASLALKDGVVSDAEKATLHKDADALAKLTEPRMEIQTEKTGAVADAKAARDDLASSSSTAMKDGKFTADEIKSAMAKVDALMSSVDRANQGSASTDGDAAFFKKLSEVLAQFVSIGDKADGADTAKKKPDDSGSLMRVEDGNYLFGLGSVVSAFERNSKQILG